MKGKNIIIIGGSLGLLYLIYKEAQNANELGQSLVFAPENISLDTTHVFAPVLKLTMQITNPTPSPVYLSSIYSTVSIDNDQIGTINNNDPITIAATTTTHLTLNITLNSIQLLTKLLSIDLSNINKLSLSFNGYYVANFIKVPLNLEFNKKIGATNPGISEKIQLGIIPRWDTGTIDAGYLIRKDSIDGKTTTLSFYNLINSEDYMYYINNVLVVLKSDYTTTINLPSKKFLIQIKKRNIYHTGTNPLLPITIKNIFLTMKRFKFTKIS